MKQVHEKEIEVENLNREQLIDRIERNIGSFEGSTQGLGTEDLRNILLHIKREEYSNILNSVVCKCIRSEGLNLTNTEDIIGDDKHNQRSSKRYSQNV